MRLKRLLLTIPAVLVLGLNLGAAPAPTSEAPVDPLAVEFQTAMEDGGNCVIDLPTGSTEGEVRCFETRAELDAFLNPPVTKPGVISPMATTTWGSGTQLGAFYQNANYGGDVLVARGGSGCYDGTAWGLTSLGGFAAYWNDSISSAKGYGGCLVHLYVDNNYGGSMKTCGRAPSGCATLGTFNDVASSLRMTKDPAY